MIYKIQKLGYIPLLVLGLIILTAGHHFETDLSQKYPQVDINDIYAFESNTPGRTVFVMSSNPQSAVNGKENFAPNGVYQFHIGYDKQLSTGMTLTYMIKDGKIKVYVINETEPPLGSFGNLMGEGPVNKVLNFDNGFKLWAGTVHDPFSGSAKGIFPFRDAAKEGRYEIEAFKNAGEDGNVFKDMYTASIAFEIPNDLLPEQVTYYGSTAIMEEGEDHYHQVNRIGHVLFPHMYMLEEDDNVKRNRGKPSTDIKLRPIVSKTVAHYVTLSKLHPDPQAYADSIAKIVLPDVVSYRIGTKANYGVKERNGRKLTDDAMNVAMAIWLGSPSPINDYSSIIPDHYISEFPYVKPVDDAYLTAGTKSMNVTSSLKNFGLQKVVKKDNASEKEDGKETDKNSMIWWLLGGAILLILLFLLKKKNDKT